MEKKPVYVAPSLEKIDKSDDEIKQMIDEKNDKQYLIPDVGVLKVGIDRWKEAQKYEQKTWCFDKKINMDRNDEHYVNFNSYEPLKFHLPTEVNIIELGCGPFTNIKWILKTFFRKIKNLDLLDPLINDYMTYTYYCTYKNKMLDQYKVNTINLPIEEFNATTMYDLVVMINVLEHCYDVKLIFDKILKMTKKNGIFVFHDKFLNKEDANEILDWYYDAGHPLKFTYEAIEDILKQNFITIYNKKYIDERNNICVYKILKRK